jgi:hypothetical protein
LGPFLLPLLDVKTIRVQPPAEQVASGIGTGAELVVGLLLLVVAALFLVPLLWRRLRPAPRLVEEDWVLIDGSNVMHWRDNTPSLEAVRNVVDQVRKLGYVPGVVFDANAGWKLFGRYLHDQEFAKMLGVEARQVLVVAKGTQADPFLLQTAREFGARIVSNDRFRDWAEAHPEVQAPGFLIRGSASDDGIRLSGLAPAKPR